MKKISLLLVSPKHAFPLLGDQQRQHFLNILPEIFYAYTNIYIFSFFSPCYTISDTQLCCFFSLKICHRLFDIGNQETLPFFKKEIE